MVLKKWGIYRKPPYEAENEGIREIGTQVSSFWYPSFEKLVLWGFGETTQASHLRAFFKSGRYL